MPIVRPEPRPGLARLLAQVDGVAPLAPVYPVFAARPVEIRSGEAVFELEVSAWHGDADGFVAPGVVAFLADMTAGAAAATVTPQGEGAPTMQLHVELARRIRADAGRLVARGAVVYAGDASILARCDIFDGHDVLVAHATTRCLSVATPGAVEPESYASIALPPLHARSPVPVGTAPTAARLLAAEVVAAADGVAQLRAPIPQWLTNFFGVANGGLMGLLAETAMDAALRSHLGDTRRECLDLQLWFTRPVQLTGTDVVVDASCRNVGRRTALVGAELMALGGRVAVHAWASYAVTPA